MGETLKPNLSQSPHGFVVMSVHLISLSPWPLAIPEIEEPRSVLNPKSHGYSNNENEKPLETLLKMPKEDKGKFFTPRE
ncbi:hypothetical protein MK805_01950 [Shimazuella sp. AN120528]|uniref:hypothetical protein n=1 Tax=Shimazuella soli TaxID=1892854 RepID=UPI001F112AF6|nr:hypothetical protein [Shimazuella soli]MCH5583731.1 hypothetical protein [Shimazuella soli]